MRLNGGKKGDEGEHTRWEGVEVGEKEKVRGSACEYREGSFCELQSGPFFHPSD